MHFVILSCILKKIRNELQKKSVHLSSGHFTVFFAAIIGILTYRDYGIAWDESAQRNIGTLCYNYVFNGDNEFLGFTDRQYGTGFELPLVIIEKLLKITDFRDVYLMRHWVTHIFSCSVPSQLMSCSISYIRTSLLLR